MLEERKAKIKNIIFDIGGVIIRIGNFDFSKFDKKWSLKEGTTKEIIRDSFRHASTGEEFVIDDYLTNVPMDDGQYREITTALFQKERVNQPLISWIRENREKFKIYALTNNTSGLDKLLREKFKIYKDFDCIFNSSEVGVLKPDPEIFRHVLDAIKAKPEECLFVDDNEKNVRAAEDLGFKAILFKNNDQFFDGLSKMHL